MVVLCCVVPILLQLSGLLSILQLDSRATKTAQRRELSSEKEYKLIEDVAQRDIARVIKSYTMMEGYEFENWLACAPPPPINGKQKTSTGASTTALGGASSSTINHTMIGGMRLPSHGSVHLLFSKKLSRGELMLLDRLQFNSSI